MAQERQRGHLPRALTAQLWIDTALHDAKQRLISPRGGGEAALRPAQSARGGDARCLLGHGEAKALIQRHDDIGAQPLLQLNNPLGRKKERAPINMRAKGHTLVGDLP